MILEQKEKLLTCEHKYIGIGITEGGRPHDAISVPWEATAHAFNMKTPDIYFAPEDMEDEEILTQLRRFKVVGCYIFIGLENYSFLEQFTELKDVHIRYGKKITDLSFMRNMKDWFMFYIEDAQLSNLDPLFESKADGGGIHSYCLGFSNCQIDDVSAIERSGIRPSELLIWDKEDRNKYENSKKVPAHKYRYYV